MSSLMREAESLGIEVYEFDFRDQVKGFYYDNTIALSKHLNDEEQTCILAEELGHHHTTVGDITDPSTLDARKQEKRARTWAHEKLLPLDRLIDASIACENCERWELANYLGVTDEFLCEALDNFKSKYGLFKEVGNFCIIFDPLTVAHYTY